MDKILEMFFDKERWEYAISKGIDKKISKKELYDLTKPENLANLYVAIREGKYEIATPHTALIPKDKPGEFRTVYINEPMDRVVLSIANDLLFELTPEMIHPNCGSYLKGKSCGQIVQEISNQAANSKDTILGWKSDLSKYFDSVPIKYIDEAFDKVEAKYGHSALIDVLRKYYHNNTFFDPDGNLHIDTYQSLKQGCAVASWLADVILYHIDEKLSKLDGIYHRYSDDMIFMGKDRVLAKKILEEELAKMNMKLNPKKVEDIIKGKFVKFLGFSINGKIISLSRNRIKTFQKEIEKRTIKKVRKGVTYKNALHSVLSYLYGDMRSFSWATSVLKIINSEEDIKTLNCFVMDCLRAVITQKTRVGGIGYVDRGVGCIMRGKGKNVAMNRKKTGDQLEGYYTIKCMRNALLTRRSLYNTLIAQLQIA